MTDGYLDFSSNGTDSIPKTARGRGGGLPAATRAASFLSGLWQSMRGFRGVRPPLRSVLCGLALRPVFLQQLQQLVTFFACTHSETFPVFGLFPSAPLPAGRVTAGTLPSPQTSPSRGTAARSSHHPVAHHHHHLRSATHGPYTKERADVVTCTLAGLSYGGTHVSVAIGVGCGLRVRVVGWMMDDG